MAVRVRLRNRGLGYGFGVRGKIVKSRDCALASDLVKVGLTTLSRPNLSHVVTHFGAAAAQPRRAATLRVAGAPEGCRFAAAGQQGLTTLGKA